MKNKHQQCGCIYSITQIICRSYPSPQNGKPSLLALTTFNAKHVYSKDKTYCSNNWPDFVKTDLSMSMKY